MTIEELEVALARVDVALGLLKREIGTEHMTLLQRWRDDLDVEISLERLRRITHTYRDPRHPSLQSWAAKSLISREPFLRFLAG